MSISTGSGEPRRPSVISAKQRAAGNKPPADSESTADTTEAKSSSTKQGGGKSAARKPAAKSGSAKPSGDAAKSSDATKSSDDAAKSAGGAKPSGAAAKSGAGKAPAGGRPAAGKGPGGKGPKRPIAPVKVSQGRNWTLIGMWAVVIAIVGGIIGSGIYFVVQNGKSWEERAGEIDGIVNYREKDPDMLARDHVQGDQSYTVKPPVGGKHNGTQQNCMGNVYDAEIADEHALHSLEHGAVWLTYDPSLPADQVKKLADKIRGKEYTMMSPYPGLDSKVSLQAWGYQLKLDNVNDGRIDEFIDTLRRNATMEEGVPCSEGITATGNQPRELGDSMQPGQ